MIKTATYCKRNLLFALMIIMAIFMALLFRIGYLMIFKADHYGIMAKQVQERERVIKAARGIIYDRNGKVLATNESVCTISVINSQVTEPDRVIEVLSKKLAIDEEKIRKLVEKKSSMEKIKSNVDKKTADEIRDCDLDGVMVDEDYKRVYPQGELASKVIGFTGSDNQGIVGLETKYDKYLKGTNGKIFTVTNAAGIRVDNKESTRQEALKGYNLYTTIDINIQKYAMQAAKKVYEQKSAKGVKIISMNPDNGEIYACVDYPEYDLNNPYKIQGKDEDENGENGALNLDALNEMWRNSCISDTYEPGSTFKIITATAALEKGVVSLDETFNCVGYKVVEDRKIRCHKTSGHGSETFVQATGNSCNPVFMELGSRVGAKDMYSCYRKLGLFSTTGVDLPGEAGPIMHKLENIGAVELATMSFGQSIQITPFALLRSVSAVINNGRLVTPHFGMYIEDDDKNVKKVIDNNQTTGVVLGDTCDKMKYILEKVVSEGGGSKGQVEGYRIGGKTATSQKLPRGSGKYIASFIGFAPADAPKIITIVLIDEPQGVYYGGTIAAPVVADIYSNILPYMDIECDK